jgi:dTDP-4-amino-4,6-dideoxygalactose transaminase
VIAPEAVSIYNQYTLTTDRRDELMTHLQKKEVGCAIYYPLPLHLQECFSELGYRNGDLPVAERLANQVLSIPIYPELNDEMKQYVVESIREFFGA